MYGLNTGYDSRPMNTGGTDTGIDASGTEKSAFFQQVAVNAEAVSNDWNFNAYALIPIGDTEQKLNWYYQGEALKTYGLDVGYFITPELNASVGYYYQNGDMGDSLLLLPKCRYGRQVDASSNSDVIRSAASISRMRPSPRPSSNKS